MSERNGDKARFQKGRVRKLRQRQRIRELLARIRAGAPPPGAREPHPARVPPPAVAAAAAPPPAPSPAAPAAARAAPPRPAASKPAAPKGAARKPRPATSD